MGGSNSSKVGLLTYLLSFFSGGDFLSQPWKRISPPLMFVGLSALSCARTARLSLVHDGSWRLVRSKSCQRSARNCRSLLPPPPDTPDTSVRNDHRQNAQLEREKKSQKCGAHKEIRSNRGKGLSWCGVRKYRRVSAVCFPTHTTPTE